MERSFDHPVRGAMDRHIPELDGLRGVAVLLVVVYHFFLFARRLPSDFITPGAIPTYLIAPVVRLGFTGVDLFFVLSGFLIGSMLLRLSDQGAPLRFFYVRRAARTLPLYCVVLFLFLVGVAGERRGLWHFPEMFGEAHHLWTYFVFMQNNSYALGADGPNALNPTWSLAIEEQFYLLFPLLFLRPARSGVRIVQLSMLVLCSIAFRSTTGMGWFFSLCRLDGLAIGAIIAVVFADSRLWESITVRRHWLISATAILAGGMLIQTKWIGAMGVLSYTWYALFYGAVLSIVLIIPSAAAPLRARPLRFFGEISYGLYLIHVPTLMFFSALFADLSSERRLICTFLAIAVSVIVASASARFFEQPARKAIRERYIVSTPHRMDDERVRITPQ